jgi:hypothetical protein
MSKESIQSHIKSLTVRHRDLDNEILQLEKHYTVTEEIRRLKTQKLWLKDEIHRLKRDLENYG